MKTFMRVFFIVLDACGVGELPDAAAYGDVGSATLPNTAAAVGGLSMPHSASLGLGRIAPIRGVSPDTPVYGGFGKMTEQAKGKDSTSGHWEHFGVVLERPFPVYPNGFPDEIISEFTRRTGYEVIGNEPASGTEIIARLGQQHLDGGALIVYTSADSVFQIAAHETPVPPDELYRVCRIAREMLVGDHGVGRVIARPFEGSPGRFTRTPRRKDFSIDPPGPFVSEELIASGRSVYAIGKIYDIMAGRGVSDKIAASGNTDCMDKTIALAAEAAAGLVMVNLVDFDMLWGHRNDVESFARGLEDFDRRLIELQEALSGDDLLIITADHGCDPTTPSTDHSREYVPLLAWHKNMRGPVDLGIRESFADTGKTIAENFGLTGAFPGRSFLREIQ